LLCYGCWVEKPQNWMGLIVGQLDSLAALVSEREPLVPVEIGDWVGPRAGIDAAAWFVIQPIAKSLYPLRYPGSYMGHSPAQTEGRSGLEFEYRMSKVQAQRESSAGMKALMQYEVPMCWKLRNLMRKAARCFLFSYKNCILHTVSSMGGLFILFINFIIYFLGSSRSCFIEGYFYKIRLAPPPPPPALVLNFLFWNRVVLLLLLALRSLSFNLNFWHNLSEAWWRTYGFHVTRCK
jgi:hypothetical protein